PSPPQVSVLSLHDALPILNGGNDYGSQVERLWVSGVRPGAGHHRGGGLGDGHRPERRGHRPGQKGPQRALRRAPMDRNEILSHVDHTLLKPEATWPQIRTLCDDAV